MARSLEQRGRNDAEVRIPIRDKDGCEHELPTAFIRKERLTRRVPVRQRPMHFTSLHHHSTYSYGDGFQVPEAHARRAAELNMSSIALTEHGNVSSHVKLETACTKEKDQFGDPNPAYGIKPIYGVELYCGPIDEEHRAQKKNHLTILAENQQGYTNMLELVSKTYAEGFYYDPTASGPMLAEHGAGLVVLSGCNSSLLFTSLVGGKHVPPEAAGYERAKRVAARFKRTFGGRYYIEVQAFPELDSHRKANPELARIAEELSIPLVASMDCHYTLPTEREIQKAIHSIDRNQSIEQLERGWGYVAPLCPPLTDRDIYRRLKLTGLSDHQAKLAILNTEEIAARCNVTIPSLPTLRYPLPRGYSDPVALWRDWLRRGWAYRGCDRLPARRRREYADRLRYEAQIIESKDFVDYFLFTSDVCSWAKDHDIFVGPGRGSAAASLVCWLLRITEVDPMRFRNLVFERFIDISREDLPDVDLDFNSEKRHLVTDYLVAKLGRDCVNNMATFTQYKAKNSLDAAARVHHVPKYEVQQIKDVLIERSSGDLRASATIEDTVLQFPQAKETFEKYPELSLAMELEGNVAGSGVHAAGLVLSNGPVHDICATYERTVNGKVYNVLSLDKYDAEKKNLLKWDFLGLNNATFLDACRSELGWSLDDLYNLPLDDPEVIDVFHRNDVVGIFQFDGRACRYVCGALGPDTFDEICDITALARPGPLHNGAANEYIDIKRGARRPKLMHPVMAELTKDTYYQIVYQEQILNIVRLIGNFDWTSAAHIRRIISRKIGEQEFNRQWHKFEAGAKTLHERTDWPAMDSDTADSIWGSCITAGSYAFNAAHARAYGLIGYWSAYFKHYHPAIYYANGLKYFAEKKQPDMLRDAVQHGVEVKPPSPKYSGRTWSKGEGKSIHAGWEQVHGIGESLATAIVEHGPVDSVDDLVKIKGIGPKTVERIKWYTTQPDPFNILKLDKAIARVKQELYEGKLGDLPMPTHVSRDLPYSRGENIEVTWLGCVHTRNVRDIFEFNQAKGRKIDIEAGTLDGKPIKDPHLNEWVVMVGDDETDQMGLRVDRWHYPAFKEALWGMSLGHDLILVKGIKPGWMPTRQIEVHQLWVIDPE